MHRLHAFWEDTAGKKKPWSNQEEAEGSWEILKMQLFGCAKVNNAIFNVYFLYFLKGLPSICSIHVEGGGPEWKPCRYCIV